MLTMPKRRLAHRAAVLIAAAIMMALALAYASHASARYAFADNGVIHGYGVLADNGVIHGFGVLHAPTVSPDDGGVIHAN